MWSPRARHATIVFKRQMFVFGGVAHGVLADESASEADLRITVVLNLWSTQPTGVPALEASEVPASDGEREPPGELKPAPVFAWQRDDSWRRHRLTMGMREQMSTVELQLPPLERPSSLRLERFMLGERVVRPA